MDITIANRLYVYDYTQEAYAWCRENLILQNPDYYKKEKMGKWTGNTPKEIALFEKFGKTCLWLPFGCIHRFMKSFPNTPYKADFPPLSRFSYNSSVNPYEYQEKAIQAVLRRKNGVLVAPCGSGKTIMGLEIVARIGGRALWLTHTQDLLNQSMTRAKSVLGRIGQGTITEGKVNCGEGITFATVQTLSKIDLAEYQDYWDVVIVDECMPGETLIDTPYGKKQLKNLRNGDIITSYNSKSNAIEDKRITHVFKSKAHDIVKIKLKNGEEIVCTGNHPVYTENGQWIDAERLVNDDYVLRLVWERSRHGRNAKYNEKQSNKTRLLLLFKRMLCERRTQKRHLDGRETENCFENNEQNKQQIPRSNRKTNENEQPHEKRGCPAICIGKTERDWPSTKDKRRKRDGNDSSSKNIVGLLGDKIKRYKYNDRVSSTNKDGKEIRTPNLLQNRHCAYRTDDSNRNRRRFSLFNRTKRTGQEKGNVFEWVGVDSVEVQEQTSDGTFGGMCPDGFVYNIEVADNNNYFANGILVHNCHHAAGSPTKVTQFYKVLSKLKARYKIGLTATPKRADGLEESMFALLGDIIYEVKKEDVAYTTCPVKVWAVQTGYAPDYDMVLLGDGTINYMELINQLVTDENRFRFVSDYINGLTGTMIVFGNRVDYLKKLSEEFKGRSVCLSGMGQSKAAKKERKDALEKLSAGELDAVFATYQLGREGLDCPSLQYVVFATPEKDESTVQQASGRVARKAEGKEYGTVIDFVDNFGMYKGWAKKRATVYKKLDYEY